MPSTSRPPSRYVPTRSRPSWSTPGYARVMRRLTEDMKRVVEEQRLAFAATVGADGTANLSPKGTIAVLDDEHLMFADLASPRTVENLRHNASIELNVVDPVTRTGYRFKGRGSVLGEGERFEQLVASYGTRDRSMARPPDRRRSGPCGSRPAAPGTAGAHRPRPDAHRSRSPGAPAVLSSDPAAADIERSRGVTPLTALHPRLGDPSRLAVDQSLPKVVD